MDKPASEAAEVSSSEEAPSTTLEEPEIEIEPENEPIEGDFDEDDAEALFDQISDNRVFDGEDEERFESLIDSMTDWMNRYASLYDNPDAIIEDLEYTETEEVEEKKNTPIVESASFAPETQQLQYTSVTYIEYEYPGMSFDSYSIQVSFSFYD